MARVDERQESLWWLVVSPSIWAVHFLISYITVAIWCAKVEPAGGPLGGARLAVVGYTIVALAGVGATAWRSWRHHRHQGGSMPHDDDTPEDRFRFLGLASLLLSGLSAVAIIYVAMPFAFIGSCR